MRRTRSITGGRKAPRVFLASVAALVTLMATPPAAARGIAVVVAVADGAELVALDEDLGVTGRLTLGARVSAMTSFDPGNAHAYAALRDGRVVRVDLARMAASAEARIGKDIAALAASSDGRYLAAAVAAPPQLVILDQALDIVRTLPGRDSDGKRTSPVNAVVDAAARRSFIAALPRLPELWEVSYDDHAAPIYPGLVHDFRLGEGIAVPGKLNARRTLLDAPVDVLLPDPFGASVLTSTPTLPMLEVIHLDVRRRIAAIDTKMPMAANAATRWRIGDRRVVAIPATDGLRLVDAESWRDFSVVPMPGSPRLVRTHALARHAWIATEDAEGPRLVALDKARGTIAATIALPAGVRVVDLALSHDARYVFVLVPGTESSLLRYDERAPDRSPRRVALAAPTALLAIAPARDDQRRSATSK